MFIEQIIEFELSEPGSWSFIKGGVEDTRLEAKAKATKKIRGQGQSFRGQTFSRPRPRTQPQVLSKKKVFKKVFQAIFNLLAYLGFLIGEGLNHKSHAMTSSKISKTGSF